MAIRLFHLEDTLWWVEVDTATQTITNKYHRPSVEADIAAITATLALPQYPQPSEVETFVAWVNSRIAAANWTAQVKATAVALMTSMYQAYQGGDPAYVDAAALIARRDALIELLARLI